MGVGRSLTVIVMVTVGLMIMAIMGVKVFVIMITVMIVVPMDMAVSMVVRMGVIPMMMVLMFVSMLMPHVLPLDSCLTFATAAYGTHQSTSSSLIRSSSPPVICN